MADIDIQCPDCKTITSVSEYAAVSFVTCKSCGRRLERPVVGADPTAGRKLRLRTETPSGPATDAEPQGYLSTIKPPKKQRRKSAWRVSQHIVAWLLFVVLASGMWYLRYGDVLATRYLNMGKQFAPIIVLAFHILILLKAFQDSIFQGILCLLVPGYSLVYIFLINDDFYARAVFAGLLVGLAEDGYIFYHDKAIVIYQAITDWLARGG
jgi:ribosomal protein S27E